MPGRHRDPEPRAAQAVQREARVRRQLLRVHRGGGPRVAGEARVPQPRGGGRTCGAARHPQGDRPLEGERARPDAHPARPRQRLRPDPAQQPAAGPRARPRPGRPADRAVRGRSRGRALGELRGARSAT